MTSSIYPQPANIAFVGSVATLAITAGGSGYTGTPTITIDAPAGQIQSEANATIDSAGTVSSITVTVEGSGYISVPTVTIGAPPSGTTATATANVSNGKVISITITNAGSGYTSAPSVTIPIETGGLTATGTPTASDGVIITLSGTILGANSGYSDGESITLADGGTGATGTAIISGGSVQSVTLTSGGSGFGLDTLTITGVTSGSSNATVAVTATADGVITSVVLSAPNFGGSGYTSIPNVVVVGAGTGATIVATISNTPSANILTNPIPITRELVSPGRGGILRLYFTFVFDVTPGDITVTNNGVDKGALNADNDSQIISNAYYRFDIDVESGDNINLRLAGTASATAITSTNFIRAHLVQFGA